MKAPNSLYHLKGNILAAVDVETTGRVAGYHEIIQIAVVPLTADITPSPDIKPFYMTIAPEHPQRKEKGASRVHGLDVDLLAQTGLNPWRVADLFDEWFQNLDLPFKKQIIPLAHNWAFERGFLLHWLGRESFDQIWHPHPRDTMLLALSINDAAVYNGKKPPFGYLNLAALCKRFGIEVHTVHDALADACLCAKLYKEMLESFS